MKKHNFSFDLSSLSTYTDEVGGLLLTEAVAKAKTAEACYIQSGIKGSQAINLLSSTLNVQPGTCGWNTSGTTTFTQRDIVVCPYKVNESLCPADLNSYWAGQFLNAGSYNEQVPFEQQIAKLKQEQISMFIENKIWQAATSASGGTDCFNGLLKLTSTAVTSSEKVNFTPTGSTSAITSSNALTQVDLLIASLPDAVLNRTDLVIMMSNQAYRNYVVALRTANYFHYTPEGAGVDFTTYHPATNIRVMGVPGLSGSNRVILAPSSEIVIGVDLMDDSERLDMFYSKDFDEVRVRCNFKLGVNIAFPENIVSNGLA